MKTEKEVIDGIEIARNESIATALKVLQLLQADKFDDAFREMPDLHLCILSKILATEMLKS